MRRTEQPGMVPWYIGLLTTVIVFIKPSLSIYTMNGSY